MNTLITHLETAVEPLFVSRTGTVRWNDEAWHTDRHQRDPERYALLALLPGIAPRQRGRMLLRLLLASWAGLDDEARTTLNRVVRVLVLGLPATEVLTVLLTARHRRANHKHVTRATLRLLLEHPQIGALMGSHRRALVACLEHALGKATARGYARLLREAKDSTSGPLGGPPDRIQGEGHAPALRYAVDPTVVRTLYDGAPSTVEVRPLADLDLAVERPATVSATNRGDVAATLVHLHRGGSSAELEVALEQYVARATEGLARFPGTLAIVLDQSSSMRGYGDREWAVLAQAEAFRRVLERRCDRLVVVALAGAGTDLATGLLDALAAGPDLVAIVSDGYENTYPGDLARVVASLPHVGETTPVVFCHSTFGHSDDLSTRRPAPTLPQRAFWHEGDFEPLLLWLLVHTETAAADQALRQALRERLATVERSMR